MGDPHTFGVQGGLRKDRECVPVGLSRVQCRDRDRPTCNE